MQETWKSVKDYEELYEVSTFGNIRNKVTGKIKNPSDNGHGYKSVSLWRNNKGNYFYLHRLVATAFIENIDNKPEVHHIDSNKANNNVNNLKWVTTKENNSFVDKIEKMKSNQNWIKTRKSSMKTASNKAIEINSLKTRFTNDGVSLEFNSLAEGARQLGLDKGNATRVANGKQAHTHGYAIEYI